mmetsp:Transcript_28878/g.72683  ORF Transcript_28878/g.72683 Transcript_28878/m.72683 type:complete len:266 (+) Transcript_28878:493-1290(+)
MTQTSPRRRDCTRSSPLALTSSRPLCSRPCAVPADRQLRCRAARHCRRGELRRSRPRKNAGAARPSARRARRNARRESVRRKEPDVNASRAQQTASNWSGRRSRLLSSLLLLRLLHPFRLLLLPHRRLPPPYHLPLLPLSGIALVLENIRHAALLLHLPLHQLLVIVTVLVSETLQRAVAVLTSLPPPPVIVIVIALLLHESLLRRPDTAPTTPLDPKLLSLSGLSLVSGLSLISDLSLISLSLISLSDLWSPSGLSRQRKLANI